MIASVKRTGKLLVVDEFTETYGITGEIAFQVSQACFDCLKMPVQRCTLPDTIIPAGPVMEDWVMLSPRRSPIGSRKSSRRKFRVGRQVILDHIILKYIFL